jgi:hypothetical protein
MKGGLAEVRFEGVAQAVPGKIVNLSAKGVSIECTGLDASDLPEIDAPAEVAFFGRDGIYIANVRTASSSDSSMLLEFTSPLRKIRLRSCQRVLCDLKTDVSELSGETTIGRWQDGVIKDISARGALFVSQTKFECGSLVVLRFALSQSASELRCSARVVNCRSAAEGGWAYGVSFEKLTPREEFTLVRYLESCRLAA